MGRPKTKITREELEVFSSMLQAGQEIYLQVCHENGRDDQNINLDIQDLRRMREYIWACTDLGIRPVTRRLCTLADAEVFDAQAYRAVLKELQDLIGEQDPEYIRYNTMLGFLEDK